MDRLTLSGRSRHGPHGALATIISWGAGSAYEQATVVEPNCDRVGAALAFMQSFVRQFRQIG